MKPILPLLSILALVAIMVAGMGCLAGDTGCIPVTIEEVRVIHSNDLFVKINGVEYGYYNPTLTTYSELTENRTRSVKFVPMFGTSQYVEVCK